MWEYTVNQGVKWKEEPKKGFWKPPSLQSNFNGKWISGRIVEHMWKERRGRNT